MKKLRYILTALMLAAAMLLLTGCVSDPKGEDELRADVFDLLPSPYLEVDSLTVDLRKTDKKEGTDFVAVTVLASAGDAQFNLGYDLEYTYYDKGGWVLESSMPQYGSNWYALGIPEDRAIQDIQASDSQHFPRTEIVSYTVGFAPGDRFEELITHVEMVSESSDVSCELSYLVRYDLTESGWVFQSCTLSTANAYPKYGADPQAVVDVASEHLGMEVSYGEGDGTFADGDETHWLYATTEYPYMSMVDTYEVVCEFNPETLRWAAKTCDKVGTEQKWDIEGTWSCSGEAGAISVYTGEYTYTYNISCVITEESSGVFRLDYDLNPAFRDDLFINGTTYLYTENAQFSDSREKSGYDKSWNIGTEEFYHFTSMRMDAQDGLYIRQSGGPTYLMTRQ